MGCDFAGTYTNLVDHQLIECALGDRTLRVEFSLGKGEVTVREAKRLASHSEQLQKYVEATQRA